jgi:hypothetical protein
MEVDNKQLLLGILINVVYHRSGTRERFSDQIMNGAKAAEQLDLLFVVLVATRGNRCDPCRRTSNSE